MTGDTGYGMRDEHPADDVWPAAVGEPGSVHSYEDLRVWQAGISLCADVYRVTSAFPADERFGLTSQMRRASVSVPSNIAEGWGRGTRADYLRFLRIARGSLFEIKTQIVIAERIGLASAADAARLTGAIEALRRPLQGLIQSLERVSS